MRSRVEIIASDAGDKTSSEMVSFLGDIAGLSEYISLKIDKKDGEEPSFQIVSGQGRRVRFAGLPMGDEYTSMILAILWAGGHPPRIHDADLEKIQEIREKCDFELYYSLGCHQCSGMVQSIALLAMNNSNVTATFKDANLRIDEAKARGIVGFPTVYLNGNLFCLGRLGVKEILARVANPSGWVIRTCPGQP
jgi:alkyl hydroperoxide reductase subunit F